MQFNCALIAIMLEFRQGDACSLTLWYREGISSDVFRYFHSNLSHILTSRISCYCFINHWYIFFLILSFLFFAMHLFQLDFPPQFIVTNLTPCLNSAVWQFSALVKENMYCYLLMLLYVSCKCYDITVTWKLYNYFSLPSCIIFLRPHLDRSPIQRSISRGWSRGHT